MAGGSIPLCMGSSINDLDTVAGDVILTDDVITFLANARRFLNIREVNFHFYDSSHQKTHIQFRSWQLAEDSYQEAVEKDNAGNEEAAYMLYKRHIHVVQKTQTTKDYLLNQSHWEPHFSKEKLLTAVERCELLGVSLQERYKTGGIMGKLKTSLQARSKGSGGGNPKDPRTSTEDEDGSGLSENDSEFDSTDEAPGEDQPPVHKAILVTDLPQHITEDAVELYFQLQRRSDGGPVEKVDLRSDGSAIVYFEDPEVAARVLKKTDHKIKNIDVTVSVYVPDEPSIKPENAIKVRGFKTLSDDALEMYFENNRTSGGDEIKYLKRSEDGSIVVIEFKSNKVAERVLKKEVHKIRNTVLQVSPYEEEPEPNEELYDASRTIEVRDFGALSDDILELYFEDTKKSGGANVSGLKSCEDVIYITFENGKATTRVLNREHTVKGQKISVHPLHSSVARQSEDTALVTDGTVKVLGCEDITDDLLTLYFQNKRRSGGGIIKSMQRNEDRTYITFENAEDAQRVLERNHKLDGYVLKVSMDGPLDTSGFEQYGELEIDSLSSDEEDTEKMFVLQVHDMKGVSEDTISLYFENRRRSGGGEVESVEFDKDQNSALIYFKDGDAVRRVLLKSPHLVEGKTLRLNAYTRSKLQGTRSWLRSLKRANAVEVKGCKELSNDKLEFYFDNKTRSGGSDVKHVKRSDENGDIAYIVFKDIKVAERVSSRHHTIGKYKLQVKQIKPGPKYDNRYLISELKESTTEDSLSRFLTKHTPWPPTGFEYGDDNDCALVTVDTSKSPLRIKDIQKVCNQRPLEGAFLDVCPVPISNCILVQGLERDTDDEHLKLYFENRKSGNTMQIPVEKVDRNIEGDALVYFANYKVIEQIIPVKHRAGSSNITVSVYMECLQSGGTVFQPPSTICLDSLNKHLVMYVRESPETEDGLRARLQNIHAELTWASDQSAVIECVLSEEVPECRKLAKTWEKTVKDTFQNFTSQFHIHTDKILDDVWDRVAPKLEQLSRDPCKIYMLPGCQIAAIAPLDKVKRFVQDIQEVISEAERESQQEMNEKTETMKTIHPLIVRLFRDSNFVDEINASGIKVKVSFSRDADQITFTGLLEDVRQAKLKTEERAKNVMILEVENMSEAQKNLAEKADVREYVQSRLMTKGLVGSWMWEEGKFKVASFTNKDGHAIVHTIKQLILDQTIDLKEESLVLLDSKQWAELVASLMENKGNFVSIITNKVKHLVTIFAIDEEIVTVTEEVNNFIKENTVHKDFVQFQPGIQRFLSEHAMDNIQALSIMYKRYAVEVTESIAKVRFNIRGTKNGLNLMRLELDKMSRKIIHRDHEFTKPGIAKLLLSDKGHKVIRNVENTERCIIESDYSPNEETKYGQASAFEHDAEKKPEVKSTSILASRQLTVCEGDITTLEVDAIVNAANQKLQHVGGLAKVISDKGGPSVQKESDEIIKRSVELLVGDAVITKAGDLPCNWIIHTVGPTWSGGRQGEEELLREAVFRAIEEADKQRIKSIAFPALSTGIYNYPKVAATRVIIDAIKDSLNENPDSTVETIYVCDTHPETVSAFIKAVEYLSNKSDAEQIPKSSGGPSKRPAGGVLMPGSVEISDGSATFVVGRVTLIVKRGDITKETVDAIVNCTNTDLNMERGGVSRSILQSGGPELAHAISTKGAEMGRNGVVVTSAGRLPCEYIVHVSVQFFDENWKKIVQRSLKAIKNIQNVKRLAFPAFGTGVYGNSPETMAGFLVEALQEYSGKHNIQEVRLVVLDDDILELLKSAVIKVTMLKGSKSTLNRIVEFVKKKITDPHVTLHFFSDNTTHIEQAIARLEEHYKDNRLDRIITDEALKRLNKEQAHEIEKLKDTFGVQVEINPRLGRVRLQGLMNDVLSAIDAVHKIIHNVHRYIQDLEKAEMLSSYLQWTYIEKDSTITEYDKLSNQAIEDAFKAGKGSVQIQLASKDVIVVDFDQMVQYPVGNTSDKLSLVRKNKIRGASFDPPTTWIEMNTESEMFLVERDSPEYKDVEQKFFDSVGSRRSIIRIQRIQTKYLWQQYVAKKEQLAVQNPGIENENMLWHGTTAEAYPSIAKAGFNRSYCGKNATAYGDGVYFAASASYSIQNAYSKPDKNGHKHVFLARVLTGVYTKGKQGLRVPPTIDESKYLVFDSVVDDPKNPSMYIIFNDTQAYPDYLISFG